MHFYLFLSLQLFIVGVFGMCFIRNHIIIMLLSLELILLGATCNFIFSSVFLDDLLGQIYGLLVLTVAAAESSVGLALVIIFYSLRGGLAVDLINLLNS